MKKKGCAICCAAALALGGAYLLSLHGRTEHPAWQTLRQYRYAHRGYHDKPTVPENSLPAFRRAVERGWGAELDVHLMKDGTLAVIHDSSLKRVADADVMIEDLTREDLENYYLEGTEEHIPLFDEVLEIFEGKTPLIIELKTKNGNHMELAEAVCERLDSYRGDFCIESFDPLAVAAVRKLRPEICRGQLAENFMKDVKSFGLGKALVGTSLSGNLLAQPDFIAFNFSQRDCISNQLCLKLWGIQGVSWTIRSKADMEAAEREGLLVIFEKFDPEE